MTLIAPLRSTDLTKVGKLYLSKFHYMYRTNLTVSDYRGVLLYMHKTQMKVIIAASH